MSWTSSKRLVLYLYQFDVPTQWKLDYFLLCTTVCRFGGVMGGISFAGRHRPYHWLTAQHTRCSVPQTQSLLTYSRSFRTEQKAEGWRLASLSGIPQGSTCVALRQRLGGVQCLF